MSELTVEKIRAGKDGREHNLGMFVIGDECYLHQEAIDFLLDKLATIERDTAAKCAEIVAGHELLEQLIGVQYTGGFNGVLSTADKSIRHHFNLGETP